MTYQAPLTDMLFTLRHAFGADRLAGLPADAAELAEPVLAEAAKLAENTLAPLNVTGDRQGCTLANGAVETPKGWKDAYAAYRDGGWNGVPFATDHGGQGLPWTLAFPIQEMWQ
ncbi:MAG: acyl-CoA dehydrogenase N-terminal domain-containing protein, partial [Alphaproteobacteria bacterium]|nr:acyl-CoA dehydrogenase N-terminal domain-containing protein [Alphaproteobacteria bacterium]